VLKLHSVITDMADALVREVGGSHQRDGIA